MQNLHSEALAPPSHVRGVAVSPHAAAALTGVLVVLGVTTIWSSALMLWDLWTTDALKSIGMIIPVVSFLLIARAWRSLGWEAEGSWWGFAILAVTFLLVRIRDHAVILLVLGPQWTLYFPPHSLVAFLYGVGAVLLFGGPRLVRAAVFPLVLLLFVNPIPHVFNLYVDLPLQRASAHVARAFAMALGQPLSPDKLRLMFTPEFGMFIAPGCNGIRGAVTMGFIALIAGYLYRFRWQALAAVVFCAVLLGYVFNFVRLCVLVLFYLVALHIPRLQDSAENADYVIGAGLFFVAVYLLYLVIQKLGSRKETSRSDELVFKLPQSAVERPRVPAGFSLRAAAMLVLVVLGLTGAAQGFKEHNIPAENAAEARNMGRFPERAGSYALVRSWNETLLTGALLFHWAEYAPDGGGTHIAVGVSPVLGSHDTMICHTARGEDPLWHAEQSFPTNGGLVQSFNGTFFNDGATQFLEETTLCNGSGCGEYATPQKHFGLVYSKPSASAVLSNQPNRPIPILLRAETVDTTLPPETARRQLTASMASFLSHVNLQGLTDPYRSE